ncbi:FAS1 domain-containing protein SELMODRAFT_448915-like [Pistacia vera]|uniref:FAS1 domain-containing protein SELMODRAFT_448915-like n=1 Tax=Pistacia vera TaxID=55513 RepID=UPI001262BAFF|nr:FAS1 domain-containing protein SELMODRAFT_448915-like [Pistacia vera]
MAPLFSSAATPTNTSSPANNQNLLVATEEMQRANYFTFVMLLKMSQLDQKILENVTFFMPNDRALAKTNMIQESVSDFLLHHSISSVLLFEHLQRIPSGSLIPSSFPEYMLNISNGGRRNYFLNNVKLISPNICTAGSSIRCHGIDGVLQFEDNNTSLPAFSNNSSPAVVAAPLEAPRPQPTSAPPTEQYDQQAPPVDDSNQVPADASLPPYVHPQKSSESSKGLAYGGLLHFFVTFATGLIMGVSIS